MSKPTDKPVAVKEPPAPKRRKQFTFPDYAGDGPAVVIEAASIEEATKLYQQQKGTASSDK